AGRAVRRESALGLGAPGGARRLNVLLTGGTGFIGRHLLRRLLACHQRVTVLVHPASDAPALAHLGVGTVPGDILDPPSLARAVAGCELVYHLAALVPTPGRPRSDYHEVNVRGTENLVQAALAAGAHHLVHASSVAVYGVPRHPPADEASP